MKKFVMIVLAIIFALSTCAFQVTSVSNAKNSGPTVESIINVNCRSGPSTNYRLLGTLKPETRVKVVGQAVNNEKLYYKIQLAEDLQCWVLGSSVAFGGDIEDVPEATFPAVDIRPNSISDWSGTWTIQLSWDSTNPKGSIYSVPVTITQDGYAVSFTIFSGTGLNQYTGQVSADGKSVTGTMGDRRFFFYRVSDNRDQFRGEWVNAERSDVSGMMCGYRGKSWAPDPCTPLE